ncbi:MAG: hypothetical protein ACYDAR_16100 [Thermomicrobiales bacterium]
MAEQQRADERTEEQASSGKTLKRRGILAAAGAVVAGLAARAASAPVEAANGDIIHVGDSLSGTFPTELFYNHAGAPPLGVWSVTNTGAADAIFGVSSGIAGSAGVRGESDVGSGVIGCFGTSAPPVAGGNGVYGYAVGTGNGVYGSAGRSGNGVKGYCTGSAASYGVFGITDVGIGVYGDAGSGIGVQGFSSSGNGVSGTTTGTGLVAGVYGASTTAYGIIGNTTASGYSGLTGITSTPGVAALAATALVSTAYAAYFSGTTVVEGDFYVVKHADGTGGGKFAAVPGRDGGFVGLYATESPEPWFEDFGEAKFVKGRAEVSLDPAFAALIHADTYHVFLTEHDTHHHLAVAHRTPSGFTVLADVEGAATRGVAVSALAGTFSWRVVGKRKDIAGTRLPRVTLPKINHPDPDKLPKPPMPHVPVKKP